MIELIILEEFIWREDCYAYHITHKNKMGEIVSKGLIPQIGERSQSINDNNKAIYFSCSLYSIDEWIDCLYGNKDIDNLELLRFNLKNRKWFIQDPTIGDFYVKRAINPERISYLKIFDSDGNISSLRNLYMALYSLEAKKYQIMWADLLNYDKLEKGLKR